MGVLSIKSAKRAQEPKLNVHPFEPCPVIVKRLGIKVWPINNNMNEKLFYITLFKINY